MRVRMQCQDCVNIASTNTGIPAALAQRPWGTCASISESEPYTDIMSGTSTFRATCQPRLISDMTPDQIEMKRASDRIHQRYSRARKKGHINELEAKNAVITSRLANTERKLKQLQESHGALRDAINALHVIVNSQSHSPVANALPQSPNHLSIDIQPSDSTTVQSNAPLQELYSPTSSLENCAPESPAINHDMLFDQPIDFGTGLMVNLFNDSLSSIAPFHLMPDAGDSWPTWNQSLRNSGVFWTNSRGTATPTVQEPERQPEIRQPQSDPEAPPIWQSTPVHLPPITPADHVLIDIQESGAQWSRQRGKPYEELSQQSFPSISSLLNPTTDDAASNPISAAVGRHTDGSVISFSSRVAYHYMVAHMVRWLVCRTEESFNQLPEYLKPTHLQRTVPHPAWVDIFPW
jgi:hypothetical protein